ncbi:TetR/AcrR family transcriptional regulator [Gramella jeungdoensis]|uniref:TetR/AcrR family transcriptional regulator n=1 Tax=Gramella jeungdoensis TaxID=708091 RepID=A0ABT0Z4H6_9FLAO|nr:TetR/AcrR family transcriptional regulator [Gramella jeungdoensis]MCM8570622.1 TetR/AcrR family transcriptional regulator [Gramella jeungdoensis]
MEYILQDIRIGINEKIFLKDPQSTELGKRIVHNGIRLINESGFESFTFRKLGKRIKSNESSIYRYFENKHKFLVYLTSWYWGWKEYQLVFATNSIENANQKLFTAIEILTKPVEQDEAFKHIDEVALNQIIINESSKSFLTKEVDAENKDGYFLIYKRLVNRLAKMIKSVNPKYPFPSSLASMIIEGSLHQYFLIDHFTSITDCSKKVSPPDYFKHLVENVLKIENNGR